MHFWDVRRFKPQKIRVGSYVPYESVMWKVVRVGETIDLERTLFPGHVRRVTVTYDELPKSIPALESRKKVA